MEPVLHSGDHILVNKFIAGARIYRKYDFSDPVLESFRMPGFRKVRPGDVVVFNYPYGYDRKRIEFRINYVYAKRCIAGPGDTVSISDGIYRNSRFPSAVFGSHELQTALGNIPDSLAAEMGVYLPAMPFTDDYGWTVKEFGPLYVPCAGASVKIDSSSLKLYGRAIEYETGTFPEVREGRVFVGGTAVSEYVFRGNWYFFGGDNVLNSRDSRYFGLVPEDYIVGVATRVLFSRDTDSGRMDWGRTMKKIR